MSILHLYFDLDGTLFETRPVIIDAVRTFLEQLGRPCPTDDAILSLVGRPMHQFMQGITGAPSVSEKEIKLFNSIEYEKVRTSGRLFVGTETALKTLKAEGHSLFVLSNGYIDYIETVLQSTGVRELFDDIYTATDSPSKAYRLREVLPENTPAAFMGDTVDDLRAARENNLPHIAAMYGYGGDALYDDASHKAYTPLDIPSIVRSLCAPA